MKNIFFHGIKLLFLLPVFIIFSCSKDNNEPETTQITVTTSDFSTTIDERPDQGQSIGIVMGSTNEGSVTFSVSEQNPEGAFSIDAVTGELRVQDETFFYFDNYPVITGTVKVSNGDVSANSAITIMLNENDLFYGDVILKTQEEVNLFGAEQYRGIVGSLKVGDPDGGQISDISDLSPLESIKMVLNNLHITGNDLLITTEGLGINQLEGELIIAANFNLKSVKGLEGLTSIGDLNISRNYELNDLSGLNQLTTIDKGFILIQLLAIPHLDWFNNLTSIGSLYIEECPVLTNIDGLSNLINLTGSDFLKISKNPLLTNLNVLSNLSGEVNFVEIGNLPALTTLEGLVNIKATHYLYVHNTQALENLNGLELTTNLTRGLFLNDNTALNNLQGVANLVSAPEMRVVRNGSLVNLEGLNNITTSNKMDIQDNPLLSDFCAFQQLFTIAAPTEYTVAGNAYNPTIQDIINGNCSL